MIIFNLARVARIKGIQYPYTFLVQKGFSPQTAKGLLSGRTKRLDFAHLETLCRIFGCEPYDLYDYKPDKHKTFIGADHLAFLTKAEAGTDIQTLIAGLSYKQMQTFLTEVEQRNKAA